MANSGKVFVGVGLREAASEVSDAASGDSDAASDVSDTASEDSDTAIEVSDTASDVSDAASGDSDAASDDSDTASEDSDTASGDSDAVSGDSDAASEVSERKIRVWGEFRVFWDCNFDRLGGVDPQTPKGGFWVWGCKVVYGMWDVLNGFAGFSTCALYHKRLFINAYSS